MRNVIPVFLVIATGLGVAIANASLNNLGSPEPATFEGHVLTDGGAAAGRVLYAPSESDDPAFRAGIAASLGGGAVVDYFDARAGTPDLPTLNSYDCVMTWANYAYSDNVLFGNNLADFVDDGGTVVLGAFAVYTIGNYLAGRIVDDPAYCPVRGGFNHFSFSTWAGDGAGDCVHASVLGYGSTYRDILTLDGTGASTVGHFTDGEISVATNSSRSVHYANGTGGFPLDGGLPDNDQVVANACTCSGPVATETSTWGNIKGLYR